MEICSKIYCCLHVIHSAKPPPLSAILLPFSLFEHTRTHTGCTLYGLVVVILLMLDVFVCLPYLSPNLNLKSQSDGPLLSQACIWVCQLQPHTSSYVCACVRVCVCVYVKPGSGYVCLSPNVLALSSISAATAQLCILVTQPHHLMVSKSSKVRKKKKPLMHLKYSVLVGLWKSTWCMVFKLFPQNKLPCAYLSVGVWLLRLDLKSPDFPWSYLAANLFGSPTPAALSVYPECGRLVPVTAGSAGKAPTVWHGTLTPRSGCFSTRRSVAWKQMAPWENERRVWEVSLSEPAGKEHCERNNC